MVSPLENLRHGKYARVAAPRRTFARIIPGIMWPWQAFDWGVFWAILAAACICLVAANLIHLFISRLSE
jgi:hypothetical protein